jgi:SAM-dependent methyltransferase
MLMRLDRLKQAISHDADFNQSRRDAWVAARARSVPRGSFVLDLGAGTGRYREHFAHCHYHAQDFAAYTGTPTGTQADRWSYTALDYVSTADLLPLLDGTIDIVLCTEVLEHVPRPIAVLREIGRVLRPGGRLFLTAPLGSGLHQQPYHYYGGYTPHFYQKFLPEAGLQVVSVEPNGGFFRHFGQEVARAGHILTYRPGRPWWHPARLVAIVTAGVIVPSLLARLDDAVFVEEFTVGYHVEAVRNERKAAAANR